MVVLICGMHRSGTSMVARLLHQCGVYLGEDKDLIPPAEDNPEGFWEHAGFRQINEEILKTFGGNWDMPPVFKDNWENSSYLNFIRPQVSDLINQFSKINIWGWKDPRNSLTLPYWKSLFPELKIVICLRNPHDVYRSLERRGYSSSVFSYNLWLSYYQKLLAAADPGTFVVTHFESYFNDPRSEIQRVLNFIGVECPKEVVDDACSTISSGLRNNHSSISDLLATNPPDEVLKNYKDLCYKAGHIYYLSLSDKEREALNGMDTDGDMTIEDYQNFVSLLKDEVLQKESQIRNLKDLTKMSNSEIERLQSELRSVYSSRSWKLIQKMQSIKAFFLGG